MKKICSLVVSRVIDKRFNLLGDCLQLITLLGPYQIENTLIHSQPHLQQLYSINWIESAHLLIFFSSAYKAQFTFISSVYQRLTNNTNNTAGYNSKEVLDIFAHFYNRLLISAWRWLQKWHWNRHCYFVMRLEIFFNSLQIYMYWPEPDPVCMVFSCNDHVFPAQNIG